MLQSSGTHPAVPLPECIDLLTKGGAVISAGIMPVPVRAWIRERPFCGPNGRMITGYRLGVDM